ncbi:MAG: metallophosphoesterase [Myxococcales bacterium]|nr:metallophosphoesterase [Myxococcales bacterium]
MSDPDGEGATGRTLEGDPATRGAEAGPAAVPVRDSYRVLHFSDVHLEQGFVGVRRRDFMNKRGIGYLNLALHRRARFAEAARKVSALPELIKRESVHIGLCTGDYTALGTWPELRFARQMMELVAGATEDFVTVPGNHDVYVPDTIADGRFEAVFGALMPNDLPELASDDGWPKVRLYGEHLAIVTFNSARPNPSVRFSSGRVPDGQLDALSRAFTHPRLAGRFLLLGTHYAPRLADGRPDTVRHGLINANDLLERCKVITRGALCHGHVHYLYHVREPGVRMDLCSAGSATYRGREGVWVYDIGRDEAFATPGAWTGERYELDPSRRVRLNAT